MPDELQPIETPESLAKQYGIEPQAPVSTQPAVPSGPFKGMPVPKEPGGMGGPGVNLAPKPPAPVAASTPALLTVTPESLAKEYGIGGPAVPAAPKAVPEPAKAVPGGGLPEALAPSRPAAPALPAAPTEPSQPSQPGERGFLGELGASAMRGVGGVLTMPRSIAGAFGIKAGEGLAETGEKLEKEYAASPSVSGEITKHPSLLANPKWWASAMPSLAVQILPIAIGALGGGVVGAGALGGEIGGALIGVADAGQRMLTWEKEHGKQLPTAEKILIGLGAGTAGAVLPGKVLGKLVGPAVLDETGNVVSRGVVPVEEAIQKIFAGKIGQAIATRAVNAATGGGAMAGFNVIENAFEKYGYNPDKQVTQGVLESLILGTAVSGLHGEVGALRDRIKAGAAAKDEAARQDGINALNEIESYQKQMQDAHEELLGQFPETRETTDIERIQSGQMAGFEERKAEQKQWAEDAAKIKEIQARVEARFQQEAEPMAKAGTTPTAGAAAPSDVPPPSPETAAPEAAAEAKPPVQPMGKAGPDAENAAAVKPEGETPAITPAPGEIVQPGPPSGVAPAQKGRIDRALERNDLAAIVKAHGGIDPKTIADYVRSPQEKKELGRKILKTGGFAPDVLFDELKSTYPDQFGHFADPEDMMRYFLDGRHERALKSFNVNDEAAVERARNEYYRDQADPGRVLSDEEWEHYSRLPDAEAEVYLNDRLDTIRRQQGWSEEDIADLHRIAENEVEEEAAGGGTPGEGGAPDLGALSYEELAARYGPEGAKYATRELPEALAPSRRPSVTRADVEAAFPTATKITQSQALKSLYDGFQVDLPNGQRIIVRRDEFIMPLAESLEAGYGKPALGPDEYAAGEYRRIERGGMITLAKGEGAGTLDHETFHAAMDLALTDREKAAVLRQYGDEEGAARAYEAWNPAEQPHSLFQKIVDFFRQIYRGLFPDAASVFAKVKGGEVWDRGERGLPEALAPTRYRVREGEEGGEWAMDGGLTGRVAGNVRAAQAEAKGILELFKSWFASPRTSPEAWETTKVIRSSAAESDVEKKRMEGLLTPFIAKTPFSSPDTLEFLKLFEHGQEAQVKDPVFREFGTLFREEERRAMQIMTMLGDAPKEIPNYIDHLWKQNETSEQLKAQLMAQVSGGRSMRGPDYFKMLRTVVDIPTGIAAGLEPKFDSLAEMALVGRSARENRIAATKRINFVEKTPGFSKTVRDLDGGTYTVEDAEGKEHAFDNPNDARRFVADNPGSVEPRFEPNVPLGYRPFPGGYGEVWAKVQREPGLMVPPEDKLTEEITGRPAEEGPFSLGETGFREVPGVNVWTRVGYRVGPEDVVRQFKDFLGRGLSGNKAFELYQSGIFATRLSQMALSFFHAAFESLNSAAVHSGEGIWDALGGAFTGDWRRAGLGLKELATSPAAVIQDVKTKMALDKLIMKHGIGIPGEATDNAMLQLARDLVKGGDRPQAETELKKILTNHFVNAFRDKDLTMGQRFVELLRGGSAPTMDFIVPFSKGGSNAFKFLAEIRRWERAHPGESPTEDVIRNIAAETHDLMDALYGQYAQDNVGMNHILRSLLTGVVQFPTWQMGSVKAGARILSGAKDVVGKVADMMHSREIRQLSIKDRMAIQYTAGLLFTIGMTGALMHMAFTGKKPETMEDYFFPKTGEVNASGVEERLQLPSYFKDAMGITHHLFRTIGAKLTAPIHILTDLIENKDYWGTQIYDPHDWVGQRGIDVIKYIGKTTAPFALQSYEQGAKGGPGRFALSLFGVRPVPREYAETPAQGVIDEYNQLMRAETTTKEAAATKKLRSDLGKLARDGDQEGFQEAATAAVEDGKLTRQQIKEIVGESQVPAGQSRFYRLPLEWMARAMDAASDYEKQQWTPLMLKKIGSAQLEMLIRNREPLVKLLKDLNMDDLAQTIADLQMPEEPLSGLDLSGLGIVRPPGEMGGMEEVQQAIGQEIEQESGEDRATGEDPAAVR